MEKAAHLVTGVVNYACGIQENIFAAIFAEAVARYYSEHYPVY